MNNRQRPERQKREGYVSLLAMSFAFGLAVFGGALAVGLRAYLVASAAEQQDILDRVTLESAANEVLGRLTAGENHSIKPSRLADIPLNRRVVAIELSLPEGKRDLRGDSDTTVLKSMQTQGLRPAPNQTSPSRFGTLESLSRDWRLSSREEDCMRQAVTVGRAPEDFRPEAAGGEGEGLTRSAVAGDQVDLRLSLTARSRTQVLWTRARFTGAGAPPWRFHDYRRLSRPGGSAACASSDQITRRRTAGWTQDRSPGVVQ